MTRLADARPRTAASPEILVFPGDPGWAGARHSLGLGDRLPAAVGMPRTAADVTALVDHAQTVGLAIAVHGRDDGPQSLHGTVLVSLALVATDEIEVALSFLA